MKSLSVVNLIGGVLALVFGLLVIFSGTNEPAAVFVGIVALVLAASCLWLTKGSDGTPSH
ncbi:MAG: hypothetical protein NTX56_13720 [Proteobacteria bacterium]|nr:hypothetical protein [Pseudomonadota bacterium]